MTNAVNHETWNHACAGYAGHFVMAQLLPSNLKDYDVLLAAQLGNISTAAAETAQIIATNAATLLLQNRSALHMLNPHLALNYLLLAVGRYVHN